jgi:hypothetical protein
MKLNRTLAQKSDRIDCGHVFYNGTLNVTNIGEPLQYGDTFQLFSAPFRDGMFPTLNLPVSDTRSGPGGTTNYRYAWKNNLQVDGTITMGVYVATVMTNTDTLVLSWSTNLVGWRLQNQTNALNVGVQSFATNWFDVPGSSETNQVIVPVVPTNPAVFYRLVSQVGMWMAVETSATAVR